MEERGSPSVRDVITKLKSDGTFDNFRKSCVSSIENEVCVRIILLVPDYIMCITCSLAWPYPLTRRALSLAI